MFDETKITFRKLQDEDLTILHKWRNEPFVKEWYGKNETTSFNDIIRKYTPRIKGEEPTECFIVHYDNTPVAFIQTYKINAYPENVKYFGVDSTVAGIDLFIGNQEFFGKGFGSLMVKEFLHNVVFAKGDILSCLVDPEPDNIRAIKLYEKVGFRYLKTIQIHGDPLPKYLMRIDKEDL